MDIATILADATRCVDAYAAARTNDPLFGRFLSSGFSLSEAFYSAERVIAAAKQTRLPRFNPFVEAGFNPDENPITDALAGMLDPSRPHGFGTRPIEALLSAIQRTNPSKESVDAITTITASLRQGPPPSVKVRKPLFEDDKLIGFVDILVRGVDYAIAIENKKRFGGETFTPLGIQTRRYARALNKMQVCWIGVYLNPAGTSATDRKFVPLRSSDLADALLAAIEPLPPDSDSTAVELTRSFLRVYKEIS